MENTYIYEEIELTYLSQATITFRITFRLHLISNDVSPGRYIVGVIDSRRSLMPFWNTNINLRSSACIYIRPREIQNLPRGWISCMAAWLTLTKVVGRISALEIWTSQARLRRLSRWPFPRSSGVVWLSLVKTKTLHPSSLIRSIRLTYPCCFNYR